MKKLFLRGAWWERNGQFLEGLFRVSRNSNYKFYFTFPIWKIFLTWRLKDISVVIFYLCFFTLTYIFSLKVFLVVFYFINSFFERKNVQMLAQASIKISKISYFSSYSFKLNEKKKVPFKKYTVWRKGEFTITFLLEWKIWSLIGGLKYSKKR